MPTELLTQKAIAMQLGTHEAARLFDPEVRLARTLCGAAAAASIVNYIRDDAAVITDGSTRGVAMSDIVHILRNFDNTTISDASGENYVWRGLTPNGASYLGALRTIFEGFDIPSTTRKGFGSVTDFDGFFQQSSDRPALLLSVSNRICTEVTFPLQRQASPASFHTEQVGTHGGHLVAILGKNKASGNYVLFDPFGNGATVEVDSLTLDMYIDLHPQGYKHAIAVAMSESALKSVDELPTHYTPTHPAGVVAIRALRTH